MGGQNPTDLARLRVQESVFGTVASTPTVSRAINRLAEHADEVTSLIQDVISGVREMVWEHAWTAGKMARPTVADPVIIDVDATLVNVHSEKEGAAPTFKRGFGFHPVLTAIDHRGGLGEVTGISLRPGNAGANTAADLIGAVDAAIATLPQRIRQCPETILVRSDGGGFTHDFIDHLQNLGVQYSVSRPLWAWILSALDITPDHKRENALDAHGDPHPAAVVLEVENAHEYLKTSKPWPENMRVIFRAEPLHPGAGDRWVDTQGRRVTAFATNTPHIPGLHAQDLDQRHRGRARMEQTIGRAKDTGLTYWPYQAAAKNQIWASIITLATNLLTWLSQSVLEGKTARYEPKRLRYRILNTPARLSRHARKTRHTLAASPWAAAILQALKKLRGLSFKT